MDAFGKYVAQQAARAAETANRIAQQRAAFDAAVRARNAASAGVNAVGGGGGGGGGNPFAGLGQAAAQAAAQAAPAALTPAPRMETFGERIARSIVENYGTPPTPPPSAATPPSFGERVARQIVDRAEQAAIEQQVRGVDGIRSAAPPVNPETGESAPSSRVYELRGGIPYWNPNTDEERAAMAASGAIQSETAYQPGNRYRRELRPAGYGDFPDPRIPRTMDPNGTFAEDELYGAGGGLKDRVPTVRRPPWESMNPVSGLGLMAANEATYQADEATGRIRVPENTGTPSGYAQAGAVDFANAARNRGTATGQSVTASARRALTGSKQKRDEDIARAQAEGGFIVVRNRETGQEYTVDATRAQNVPDGWVIVATSATQPERDRDRGANDGLNEAVSTVTGKIPSPGDLWDALGENMPEGGAMLSGIDLITDFVDTTKGVVTQIGDLPVPDVIEGVGGLIGSGSSNIWDMVQGVVDDPTGTAASAIAGGWDFLSDYITNAGTLTEIVNNPDAAVEALATTTPGLGPLIKSVWDNTPEPLKDLVRAAPNSLNYLLNWSTDQMIHDVMTARNGGFDASAGNIFQTVLNVVPQGVGQGLLFSLGEFVQAGDSSRGISQGKNFDLFTWLEGTSRVTYADGVERTVSNEDIAAHPEIFAGLTIVPTGDIADAAYLNGIDIDGDGQVDVTGDEAVKFLWYAQLNAGGTFIYETGADPLNFLPLVGVVGGKVVGVSRVAEAAAKSGIAVRVAQGGQRVGQGIQISARVVDEAASLGMGILLEHGVIPAVSKGGKWIGFLKESNLSRQSSEIGEAAGSAGGITTRTNDPRTSGAEGGEPVDLPTVTANGRSDTPSRGPDRRTSGAEGGEPATLAGPVARTEPPAPVEPGPDLRTPDGGTVATRVSDGEGGTVTRTIDERGIRAVRRDDSTFRAREVNTSQGVVDASGVPPRFDESIRRSANINGIGPVQRQIDLYRNEGRFVRQVAASEALGDGATATVDNALQTDDFVWEWNEALGVADTPYTPARVSVTNNDFLNAEAVIHQPWDVTARQRQNLYKSGQVVQRLPDAPTPAQMAAAERYADLVDAHLRRNPMDYNEPSFKEARQRAAAIRRKLADMGYQGRRGGSITQGGRAIRDAATRSQDAAVEDAALRAGRDATADDGLANAAQGRKVLLDGETELYEVGGHPVIDEGRTRVNGKDLETIEVRLDEDTTVFVEPVPGREVPSAEKGRFPEAARNSVWYRGELVDDAVEPGTAVTFAPDPDTVVIRAAQDAEARGLLTPALTPSPNGQTPTPIRPDVQVSPNGRTATATATPDTITTAAGEVIPASELTPVSANGKRPGLRAAKQAAPDAPAMVQEMIAKGWVEDEAVGQSFLANVAGPRNWTVEDTRLILGSLDEYRRATGFNGPIAVPFDMANPEVKAMLDRAETLARKQQAITEAQRIVSSRHATDPAKKGAQAKLKQLQTEMEALRKELGFPARGEQPKAANRARATTQDEATSLLERLNPPGKREKAYIGNLKKLTTLETGPNVARGLTLDRHGLLRFHGAVLDDIETEALTRHVFDNGDTLLDRWNTYLADVVEGGERTTLGSGDGVQAALDMAMRDYEVLIKTKFPVREVPKILRPMATITRYLREKILGSWLAAPRYVGTQALGNPILLSLGGYGDPETLTRMYAGIRRAMQAEREMGTLVGADVFDYSHAILNSDRIAVEWGTARGPEVRRHVSSGTDITNEYGVVEGFMRRHNLPGARVGAAVFGDTRVIRLAGAFDMAARDTVFTAAFQRQIKEAITDFRLQANKLLMDTGMTRRQAVETVERFRAAHPGAFTSNDVRAFFKDYLPDGVSERLGRDWQSHVNTTTKHARSEVVRVTFSGKETKLDAFLKNVTLFHYFMSRQYMYLWRQALHHPGLINIYMNANEALADYAEQNELPAWLEGTIRFMRWLPGGQAAYFNPTAMFQVGNLFGAPDVDFGDEDMGWLEKILESKYADFVFLHPAITDGLNLFGYLGDTRDLDPLRLMQEFNVFNLAVNWGAQTGWLPNVEGPMLGNKALNAGNRLRSLVSGILPGSEAIEFVDNAQKDQREIRGLIVDEAKKAGIDPETPEGQAAIAAIIDDPNDPIHKAAMDRWLWGETLAVGLRLVPGLASLRPQVRALNLKGKDLLTNTTENEKRLQNTTDPRASKIKTQGTQFYNIGDDEVKTVDLIYNDIVFSDEVFFDVTVDGVEYTHNEIEKMTDEERKDLAQAWMAENNVRGIWQDLQDEQNAFLADPENREFAQFKSWQRGVFDYEGGVDQYWKDLIEGNPNAKRFYEGLDPSLSEKERRDALTGSYAFMAIAGIPTGWAQDKDGEWYPTSNYRSPKPLPTNDYDPLDIANGPAKPIAQEPYVNEYNEDLVADLDSYQKYRAEDEVILQQIYADWGMSPDTNLGTLDYKSRQAVEKEFKARNDGYGISKPSAKVVEYFRWRDANPGKSLEDYIRWKDIQYEENLPENFTKDQQRPKGEAKDTDAYDYWNSDEWRGDE